MESFHPHDEELSLKLLIVFSRAFHRVAEKIKEDIRSHNLNPTEFAVLELLYHKGEQPIQQIGKKILLSSGSITYVVDKLEQKGLVYRSNCPKDRRVIYAVITDRGKQLMEEIFPKHKKAVQQIFSALNPEEKKIFISLLKKLGFSLEP
jgi:MarR family 2-MHQ and catechol resistance regulon transcriptional repressor